MALALNFPCIAFKNFVDKYVQGNEFELATDSNPKFQEYRRSILEIESRCTAGELKFNYLVSVLFLRPPAKIIRDKLEAMNFDFSTLTQNPYVG